MLFAEAGRQVRALAHRSDIAKVVASSNDITIRELFAPAAAIADLDALLAVSVDGHIVGANIDVDLLSVMRAMAAGDLGPRLQSLLRSNNRVDRRSFQDTRSLGAFGSTLNLHQRGAFGHVIIDPLFDDFGDVSGALIGVRILDRSEETLEQFSKLSGVGVLVLSDEKVASVAGGPAPDLLFEAAGDARLVPSVDGKNVARCVDYVASLKVCATPTSPKRWPRNSRCFASARSRLGP